MHRAIDSHISRSSIWSKTNQVRGDSPTGLAHHSFWGATYYREDMKLEKNMDLNRFVMVMQVMAIYM